MQFLYLSFKFQDVHIYIYIYMYIIYEARRDAGRGGMAAERSLDFVSVQKGIGGDMVMQPPEAKKSSRVSTASTAPSLGSSSARASDVIWLHQH